jgi:hypothetical protein
MWEVDVSEQWSKDRKWYEKKRPKELAAVLNNLDRYRAQLNIARNSKAVQAGYLHHEPQGVVAIDQKGGGGNLQETRLYTFADDQNRVLYIITIGNKSDQDSDIEFSKKFVDLLLQNSTDEI